VIVEFVNLAQMEVVRVEMERIVITVQIVVVHLELAQVMVTTGVVLNYIYVRCFKCLK
jgi:hypothetical protein